jgi:hypothetical protein
MSGEDYQVKWGAIADSDALVSIVPLASVPAGTAVVEQALAAANVFTMASGEISGELKFFLYCQDVSSGSMILIQSNINKMDAEPSMILTLKVTSTQGNDQSLVDQLTQIIQGALS